jgi:hypothetical protein
MQRLDEALRHRSERGNPVGVEHMIARLTAELDGSDTADVMAQPRWLGLPFGWRAGLAFVAAMVLVLITIGVAGLLREDTSDVVDTPDVSLEEPTTPESAAETNLPGAGAPAPAAIPPLGDGWDVILSTSPGDNPALEPFGLFRTNIGSYVLYFDNEAGSQQYRLMAFEDDQPALGDIETPLTGFTDGGPGVVAWANVGPETDLEAQIWVSSAGIHFEQVAKDLLVGCETEPNCHGAEILVATSSPDGRVVALAYDGLVWDPETGNYDVTEVALVSEDGYQWSRHPIDLVTVLPEEWEGFANIQSPLVYVNGRWLTYATRIVWGISADTVILTSTDGVDWEMVETGDLFDGTSELGLAASHAGVITVAHDSIYWSPDGMEWTSVASEVSGSPVAYDDGFVVVGASTIWYSPDGIDWTSMPFDLDETIHWNQIVGYGPDLMAVGVTEENLRAIWHWEP